MAESTQPVIPNITPGRAFKGHAKTVFAIVVFPDNRRRMVTGSADKMLHLWDLEDGVVLKKMEGHRSEVYAIAVSKDGRLIASGDKIGELIVWDGDTGVSLARPIKAHSDKICSLDLSPDGTVLATGSRDKTTKLWNTKTWHLQEHPLNCRARIFCVRYSPSGRTLAIATEQDILIFDTVTKQFITSFNAHNAISGALNLSLTWTPDGTRLLSGGSTSDPTIREWDALTWRQIGISWKGHSDEIHSIAVHPTGTLVASTSHDNHVRLWRFPDRRTIALFKHSDTPYSVTFSVDGKQILSAGRDKKISEWAIPEDALPNFKIANINMAIRNACLVGDLDSAEELLTKDIHAHPNNCNTYAIRSLVMARKLNWDHALRDALESVSILPSSAGYISQGISFCGKMHFQDAMRALDLASKFTNEDPKTIQLLQLIKAITLFNANRRDEAILRVQRLAAARPNVDTLACSIVEGYLRLQINALDNAHDNETADNFTAVFNTIAVASKSTICSEYDDFILLFGWDLEFLWRTANQKRCNAFLRAGRLREAHELYRYIMDMSDEAAKATCLDWSTAFVQKCNALYAANGVASLVASGDTAFVAKDHDRAIELYSAAINLDSATCTTFANRSKVRCGKMLWEDALLDARKVIELDPSSYVGYQLKHAALHGAQRYNEAIEAFKMMLLKLDNAPNIEMRKLRRQYVSPFEVEMAFRRVIDAQMENAPPRLLNTSTGRLCDRAAQINAFKTTTEYNELVLSIMMRGDIQMEHVQGMVETYFRYVMLSHRWEGKEPLLYDIQDKIVYDLDAVGGNVKLQSFCKTARDAGYHWAWSDTCCIDKNNNVELQESVNSMFVWYRQSALTIIYLSDVPPSSKSGALAKSAWNTRGWTVQEFLAPKIVLFYQKDWTLYLGDRSPNHKDSIAIMQEMGDATDIDAQALVAFRPGTRDAREKLQWASARTTTLQEDIAYSLFGIFSVHLAPIYGEKKQNALGRLVQEIVAQSGDVSALDWVGKSSEFNSCLPAEITSYQAPPCMLPSLSEDEIQKSISYLQDALAVESATRLYNELDSLSVARFAHHRLHLPCLAFLVTAVKSRHGQGQETHFTYQVKANGLHDLLITTEDRLIQFWPGRPTLQTFLIVRPWNRDLLELPDFTELPDPRSPIDSQGMEDQSTSPASPLHGFPPTSSGENGLVDSEPQSRALRLIVRLGEPFSGFLLAQQRGGEFRRIASEHEIIALIEDVASVHSMMEVRTLEIL